MKSLFLVSIVLLKIINKIECCKDVQVQQNFDINSYVSKRWYVHQQMVTSYLPKERNNCVNAQYTLLSKKSFWGYNVEVRNSAFDRSQNKKYEGRVICAKQTEESAKLLVGPCFLPPIEGWTAGPYWVLSYDEDMGYALVIGGQPTIQTDQGCITGQGPKNRKGLWIFTRESKRDQQLIDHVREIAKSQGLDISVLNDVDQNNCSY